MDGLFFMFMQNPGRTKIRSLFSSCSFVSFVVVCCLLLAGCSGEPKHPTWKNATGAEQHERLMWKAIHDKDWASYESHLSGTFVGVNASGQLFDRAGWLDQWKSSPVQDFSLGELQVQPEGPDMKVTYIIQFQGTQGPGLRVVSVWQQLKKGWILSAISMTPVQNR
jgi:Domain of unknown function (DUF4440)